MTRTFQQMCCATVAYLTALMRACGVKGDKTIVWQVDQYSMIGNLTIRNAKCAGMIDREIGCMRDDGSVVCRLLRRGCQGNTRLLFGCRCKHRTWGSLRSLLRLQE